MMTFLSPRIRAKRNRIGLVTNQATSASFSALTVNLLPFACRLETLEDREHVVVPMVILTEGVHNGSEGSLYYPADELAKTPEAWNHKPIVVYHPTMNGKSVSACDPTIINSRKIGIMLNTRYEGGKLKSEAWIEKSRADSVDVRIMKAVNDGEMMELSTGVFLDVDSTVGKWKEEDYQGIARNFRADHLALLPDQIGACSIQDGAGFIRNQAHNGFLVTMMRKFGLVSNEQMSHSVVADRLEAALKARFNSNDMPGCYCWVQDVFNNFVIYSSGGRLWRLGYSETDTGVKLAEGQPSEVFRVTQYRTVTANNNSPASGTTNNQSMNKKDSVDQIIAANKGWTETNRASLMEMKEADLQLIHNMVKAPAAAPAAAPATAPVAAPAAAAAVPAAAPAVNTAAPAAAVPAARPQSVDEYVASAPEGMREVLRNSLALHAEEKTNLIAKITGNANNPFTKEQLEKKDIAELRGLAKLAGLDVRPNFSGQADTVTANSNEPCLALPEMKFDQPAAAGR